MDTSISEETKNKVYEIIKKHSEIKKVIHFNSTPVGYKYQISFTIYVDGNLSTFESHKIADDLEKEIDIKLDIRVGTIIDAQVFDKAKRPAYKLLIDFGSEIGIKKSSAQITDLYKPDDLIDRQILAVVNFKPKQVADFMSEVLVLGTYSKDGVVLITPSMKVSNGDKLG